MVWSSRSVFVLFVLVLVMGVSACTPEDDPDLRPKPDPGAGKNRPVIDSLNWQAFIEEGVTRTVDLTFSFYDEDNSACWISLWGHDKVTRQYFPMTAFSGDINISTTKYPPGTEHKLTWEAFRDAPGKTSNDFQLFLRISDQWRVGAGFYKIIDISGGPAAATYPVSEGWGIDVTREEYKTNKIVLRELPDGRWAGVYEITQKQWLNVMGNWPDSYYQPSSSDGLSNTHPAYYVSWNDITGSGSYNNGFIATLRAKADLATLNLPTKGAWEYACRAGAKNDFNDFTQNNGLGSDEVLALDTSGWYANNSNQTTHEVGQKQPNAWGLYDTHGNSMEFTTARCWEKFWGKCTVCGGHMLAEAKKTKASSDSKQKLELRQAGFGFRLAIPPSTPTTKSLFYPAFVQEHIDEFFQKDTNAFSEKAKMTFAQGNTVGGKLGTIATDEVTEGE